MTETMTRRERQRQATLDEIVSVSRQLLREPGGLSLRSVAQHMGITPPALYRYVANYQELLDLVVENIDGDVASQLNDARDRYPDDDPAAQIIAMSIAFRTWALRNREDFGLVFANPLASHHSLEDMREEKVGQVFSEIFLRLWQTFAFPIPSLDEIDPAVVATFDDPFTPTKIEGLPPEARGLLWVFMQSWVDLYGTVTLEVFGHCDPRVIESGALFYSMLAKQAETLGMVAELPRLLPMIEEELAR